MYNNFKQSIIKHINLSIFFILMSCTIISTFFSTYYIFDSQFAWLNSQLYDFLLIRVTVTDIVMFSLGLFYIVRLRKHSTTNPNIVVRIIFIFFVLLIIELLLTNTLNGFVFYTILKNLQFFILFYIAYQFFEQISFTQSITFKKIFVSLCAFMSVIGLLQFILQNDLGLRFFGEPDLNLGYYIAKYTMLDHVFIRSYGLFSHPNIYGMFLVMGLFFAFQLKELLKDKTLEKKFVTISIFIISIGIITSFSKLGIVLAAIIAYSRSSFDKSFVKYETQFLAIVKKYYHLVFITLLSLPVISILFNNVLQIVTQNSFFERWVYIKAAFDMIQAHPIIGIGYFKTIEVLPSYTHNILEYWQIQPIHNVFLSMAAENGIVMALLFIAIFYFILKNLVEQLSCTNKVNQPNIDSNAVKQKLLLLLILLTSLSFDHYFYTNLQAQYLFWILLGYLASRKTSLKI